MFVATLMCCIVKILKTLIGSITSLYLKIIVETQNETSTGLKRHIGYQRSNVIAPGLLSYAVSRETSPRIAYTDPKGYVLSNEQ